MKIPALSKRSSHTPSYTMIVVRTAILVTLLQGVASAQTSPATYTQCTLTGAVNGFFGGYQVYGSFSGPTGAVPTVSNITLNGAGSSGYFYHFTGPLNGEGYIVASQIPPTPCDILGCTAPPPPGLAGLTVATFGTNATLAFTDSGEPFNGSGTLSCAAVPPTPPGCAAAINGALSGPTLNSGTIGNPGSILAGNVNITASFTPAGGLQAAATACNVTRFDWIQIITGMPDPSPFCQLPSGAGANPQPFCDQTVSSAGPYPSHLTSHSAPYHDPPSPDYTYVPFSWDGGGDSYPFYYDPNTSGYPMSLDTQTSDDDATLSYFDSPRNYCISGPLGAPSWAYLFGAPGYPASRIQALCGYSVTPQGSYSYFQTHLAGITGGTPIDFGIGFDWKSNYNGTFGGIATTLAIPGEPVDPNGVGGITITNVSNTTNYEPSGTSAGSTLLEGNQIVVTASGLAYSRVTKAFGGTVTIKNISGSAITGPFQIVFNSLTAGVTLANATSTFGGWSYITVPSVANLSPGQSATVAVQFTNPSNAIIQFIPLSYAGSFTN
jgi:hypothetical protein